MLKGTNDEISAGTGGRLAGPIAKAVLDAALAGEARLMRGRVPRDDRTCCGTRSARAAR